MKNGKRFTSSSATRQGGPLLPLSFSVILEVLATAMRQENDRQDIQTGKEEGKYFRLRTKMTVQVFSMKKVGKKT